MINLQVHDHLTSFFLKKLQQTTKYGYHKNKTNHEVTKCESVVFIFLV